MNINFITLQRVIIAACSENCRKGIKESRAKFRSSVLNDVVYTLATVAEMVSFLEY